MTKEINDYQFRQQQGYEMAIIEIKPILSEVLKIIAKPNQTRDKIKKYLKINPEATWQKIVSDLSLSSNQLVKHHLPKIKLINKIEEILND